jgi:imidazolonepropionase-like amidohydrolase
MKRFLPLCLLICGLCSTAWSAAVPSGVVAYTHGQWWDGKAFTAGDRYVQGDLFVRKPTVAPGRTVDLHGMYVVPPFGDAHNHMPGSPAAFDAAAVDAGVFYFMNPNIMASLVPGLRAYLAAPGHIDTRLAIGGITAPGGHPEKLYEDILTKYVYTDMKPEQMVGDAFNYVTKPADIDPVMDKLMAEHTDFVKIFLLYSEDFAKRKDDPAMRGDKGLDPALVPAIVAAAHKRGLKVAAHIETAADFRVVVAAGVDEAAHMPGYVALEDPISKYAITDADAAAAAKARMTVVTTAWLGGNTRDLAQRLPAVQAMQKANLLKLQAAGVPLILGTDGDAGSVIKEARYLMSLGVVDSPTLLQLLCVDTPRFIFPGRRIGMLAPGYEASFLALKADPSVDLAGLTQIGFRVKQGLELEATQPKP